MGVALGGDGRSIWWAWLLASSDVLIASSLSQHRLTNHGWIRRWLRWMSTSFMTARTETQCTDCCLKGVQRIDELVNSPSPARIFNTVLFPLPLTPNTPTLAPLTKVRLASLKRCRPPGICFETLLKVSTGSAVSEDDPLPPPRPPPELAEPLFLPLPLFLTARKELMHRFESCMGGSFATRSGEKSPQRVLLAVMPNRSLKSWRYDTATTVVLSNRSSPLGLQLLVLLQRLKPIPCDFLRSKT